METACELMGKKPVSARAKAVIAIVFLIRLLSFRLTKSKEESQRDRDRTTKSIIGASRSKNFAAQSMLPKDSPGQGPAGQPRRAVPERAWAHFQRATPYLTYQRPGLQCVLGPGARAPPSPTSSRASDGAVDRRAVDRRGRREPGRRRLVDVLVNTCKYLVNEPGQGGIRSRRPFMGTRIL